MDVEGRKRAAAQAACRLVKPGMVLGLGTGSTVQYVLEELAARVQAGERLLGVPTSRRTEEECGRLGLPLTDFTRHPRLDLTIDGADEIDPALNLIKGGGGALLREKVVASASRAMAVVADAGKLVEVLGTTFPVPVEVVPFAVPIVQGRLDGLGARTQIRQHEGRDYVTDNGNRILDARFESLPHPPAMEATIKMLPGVAEVGLFCGVATRAFVAGDEGVREMLPDPDKPL